YAYYHTSLLQGLSWIEPPTWQSTFRVLRELTFGWSWIAFLLLPSIVAYAVMRTRRRPGASASEAGIVPGEGIEDLWTLLAVWFGFAWFGLLVSSWVGQPAMVSRYELPAAVPAMLMPLLTAYRIRPWAPLAIAAVFMVGTAPDWTIRSWRVEPGFRELTAYLEAHTDPDTDAVVLVIDNTTYPNWEEAERLPLAYYSLEDRPVYEVHLDGAGRIKEGAILSDPRALQLIVFRADALAIAESAGRAIEPIQYNGLRYSQLLFAPYRLARVAAQGDSQ
ncbi:MAG: hypothetical protein KJ749_05325, partial [Planctomycetes bacterium]|nr:hypothetical protein [Planctomycetota bacterium]